MQKIIMAMLLMGAPGFASAQAAGSEPAAPQKFARELGSHRFTSAVGLPSPFLSTFLSAGVGVAGTSNLKVDLYDLQDPPQLLTTEEIDLLYLIEGLSYQHRIGRDFAVHATLSGSGRLGTESAALLTEGVSVITGWSAGGLARLMDKPRFQLSGSLDLGANSLTTVSLREFAEDIRDFGLTDSTTSVVATHQNFRATAGLRAAYAQSLTVGYLLYGDVGIQEPYEEDEDSEIVGLIGGAVSLDMRERWKPDIGFSFSSSFQSNTARNDDLGAGSWLTSVGMFYTGRPDFVVGARGTFSRLGQSTADRDFTVFGFTFLLRYDFF